MFGAQSSVPVFTTALNRSVPVSEAPLFPTRYIPVIYTLLDCDGARAETIYRLSAKRTRPFKSAGASVQSAIGSRGVRISGSNAGYTTLRGSVKSTGYPLYSPVSPSFPLPCVTMRHHISTGLYNFLVYGLFCRINSFFFSGLSTLLLLTFLIVPSMLHVSTIFSFRNLLFEVMKITKYEASTA